MTPSTPATEPWERKLSVFLARTAVSLLCLVGVVLLVATCGLWVRLLVRTFLFGWHLGGW
jgi:hypothetical protein